MFAPVQGPLRRSLSEGPRPPQTSLDHAEACDGHKVWSQAASYRPGTVMGGHTGLSGVGLAFHTLYAVMTSGARDDV